jgi:diacylglycerol kinase (ATP)
VIRIWRATRNSWNGFLAVTGTEASVRLEIVALALAIPAALMLAPDAVTRILLLGSLTLVLIVEFLNTAIEKLCDRLTRKRDAAIGRIKDMSSTAVGLSLLLTGAIWLWALAAFVQRP